nr:glycosyl hydrolase [Micromonospora sp. DSM 115978]
MPPVSPGATTQARNLLQYVEGVYGKRILSGQQESTWIDGPDHEMNHIRSHTGKLPAIRGLDFGDSKDLAPRAIAWWKAGGIPMIGYHMGAPTGPDTYPGTKLAVSIDATLTPGTAEHASFTERLDAVADMLSELRDSGVAVIWRPFHEAGGAWFWWSKEGGAQYVRLWRHMFAHLTQRRGLGNLIWLHGYNETPDPAFYPGAGYVDIGGADAYADDGDHGPLAPMYRASRDVYGDHMPIALHENGPIPDPDLLRSSGARWVLFGTWHGNHLTVSNSADHLRRVYQHDYVITRDEVPDLR